MGEGWGSEPGKGRHLGKGILSNRSPVVDNWRLMSLGNSGKQWRTHLSVFSSGWKRAGMCTQ